MDVGNKQMKYLKKSDCASRDPLQFGLPLLMGQTSQHLGFPTLQQR